MEQIKMFLGFYTNTVSPSSWIAASLKTAQAYQKGTAMVKSLRRRTRAFLADRHALPYMAPRPWQKSLLEQHPELKAALAQHLQSVGQYVRAMDIVEFMAEPANLVRYALKKPISLSTAQAWMHLLEYRWTKVPSGQYVDGHERTDVVDYRQNVFLPAMAKTDGRSCQWDRDGNEVTDIVPPPTSAPPAISSPPPHATLSPPGSEPSTSSSAPTPTTISDSTGTSPTSSTEPGQCPTVRTVTPPAPTRRVVYWYHDESVFYVHDRRRTRWVHKSEKAVPRAKGEGASLMVTDFVSANYGWLRSPDGKESTRVLFQPGKNGDGYFTHDEILAQATKAMDILSRHYPDEDHVLIFDNAMTHLKRAADALSARHMSMKPTQEGMPMFGVEMPMRGENGKPVYDLTGRC
ncbi:hypothetical protein BN946_scf184863.g11 [Trametes cinnabarina]|uniref:Uncharacterized protein n=1 Tax=Pycnoporus cinnabarinus TaxID=5643 RepID=A0A060SAE4_PYCCI|nr:hypothetical protein BN946_scf184863.g11 [Trametes cinnabarina]